MPSKAEELRELPDDELTARIESAKEELFNLRFQLATGQLDNPSRIRQGRPASDPDGRPQGCRGLARFRRSAAPSQGTRGRRSG